MAEDRASYRSRLVEKLADSLSGAIPEGTPRWVHGPVSLKGKATAVIGMRRAGKTTFLNQLRRERVAGGCRVRRSPTSTSRTSSSSGWAAAISRADRRVPPAVPACRQHDTPAWCLDEIQVVAGWERFVRRVLDAGDGDIALSGSSAALLSREMATALRGRAWEVPMYPFSFEEAQRHPGRAVPEQRAVLPPEDARRLEHDFLEYLGAGGFPEAQGSRRRPAQAPARLRGRRDPEGRDRAPRGEQRDRPALDGPPPARQCRGGVQRAEVLLGAPEPGHQHLKGHCPRRGPATSRTASSCGRCGWSRTPSGSGW